MLLGLGQPSLSWTPQWQKGLPYTWTPGAKFPSWLLRAHSHF